MFQSKQINILLRWSLNLLSQKITFLFSFNFFLLFVFSLMLALPRSRSLPLSTIHRLLFAIFLILIFFPLIIGCLMLLCRKYAGIVFVELILIGLFKKLRYAKAHQMIHDLNGDSPLGIVDVWKVVVLFCQFLYLFQNLLVAELLIVPAFKIQHPAFYLLRLSMKKKQLFKLVQHPKMLCSECSLNWQNAMTIPSYFFALLMNVFHYGTYHFQGINLGIDRIYFDKAQALNQRISYVHICLNLHQQPICLFAVVGDLSFKGNIFSVLFDLFVNKLLGDITVDCLNILKQKVGYFSQKIVGISQRLFLSILIATDQETLA